MDAAIRKYLAEIGRRGGRKSRRVLSSDLARNMVKIREAARAYKLFHSKCFWSYDPHYKIKLQDINWVAQELLKNGSRRAWEVGVKLCR